MLAERGTIRDPCIERIVGDIVHACAGHEVRFITQTVVFAKFDFRIIRLRRNIERVFALIGMYESSERQEVGDLWVVRFGPTEVSANYFESELRNGKAYESSARP